MSASSTAVAAGLAVSTPSPAETAAAGAPAVPMPSLAVAALTVSPPSPAVAGLEQQLAQLFATARTHMMGRAAAVHPDLSPSAFKVISALVHSGPCHAVTLSNELAADKSVISRLVKQLADLGLVERRADPDDGRAFVIAPTPVAVQKVNAVRDESRGRLHQFLAGWDEAEIEQLTTLLAKLNGVGRTGE